MVLNKLRKGERRSLTSLSSPRTSLEVAATSSSSSSPPPPPPPPRDPDPDLAHDRDDCSSPAINNSKDTDPTLLLLHPTLVQGGRSLSPGQSEMDGPMDEQELLHIRLKDEAARRALGGHSPSASSPAPTMNPAASSSSPLSHHPPAARSSGAPGLAAADRGTLDGTNSGQKYDSLLEAAGLGAGTHAANGGDAATAGPSARSGPSSTSTPGDSRCNLDSTPHLAPHLRPDDSRPRDDTPIDERPPVLPPLGLESADQPFLTPIAETPGAGSGLGRQLGTVGGVEDANLPAPDARSNKGGTDTLPTLLDSQGHQRRGSLPVGLPVVNESPLRKDTSSPRPDGKAHGGALVQEGKQVQPDTNMPAAAETQVNRSQTYGPEQQLSSTAVTKEPVVLSTKTHRYIETPMPTISFPEPKAALSSILPGRRGGGEGGKATDSTADDAPGTAPPTTSSSSTNAPLQQLGNRGSGKNAVLPNVAQEIPHYMFVEYTAKVCQECVDSENRMHMLRSGGNNGQGMGRPWRYTYKDPEEHRPLPSDDPNTTKTGRKEYQDSVSLISPPKKGEKGGPGAEDATSEERGPCQCKECLKNREIVRYAAENGLIEKIFDGVVHPLSERIVTTTTTQIIRAPIIEETVVTVQCQEPDCPECKKLDDEYKANQLRDLMQDKFEGMVIHETGDSSEYKDYKNLWNLRDGASTMHDEDGRGQGRDGGEKTTEVDRLNTLLSRAGNPRQERLRGQEAHSTGHEISENELVEFDSSQVGGRDGRDAHDHPVEGDENCEICRPGGSILAHRGMKELLGSSSPSAAHPETATTAA